MKKTLLSLTFLISATFLSAQNLTWAKKLGGTNDEVGKSVAVDASGNVYTTGQFRGTVDFDPGATTFTMTSLGDWDVYVSKLDASGNFVWAKSFGSSGASDDQGFSICLDAVGNVYTTGYFRGTVDFDPSAATFTLSSAGQRDAFINVLDGSGNFIRAKQLGGAGDDVGYSIVVPGSGPGGNITTCGYFNGTADFDPSVTTNTLVSNGGNDIFISQLDQFGNYLWAKQIGSTAGDVATCITFDASANLVVAGYFQGTADFDPSASTFTMANVGSGDVFVTKLTGAGSFIWAKSMGGANFDAILSVTTDALYNIYTTGYYSGTADFNPAAATFTLASAGIDDIFVSKLDVTGNFVWAKSMGGTGSEKAYSIDVDGSGNVYTTGSYYGVCDFDPGAGTFTLSSVSGNDDIFINKLDASGNFGWAKSIGNSLNYDVGYGLTIDASNNIYTTGSFEGTVDFDPNGGIFNLIATAQIDAFVLKLSNCVSLNPIAAANNTACAGSSINFSVSTTGTATPTYSWSGPNSFTANIQTPSIATSGTVDSGVYTVTITNGLCVETATTQVNVTICTGLQSMLNDNMNSVLIYPNPTQSILNIKTDETIEVITVYNLLGAIALEEKNNSFSVEQLPAGIYILQIKTEKGNSTVRFIKE